MKQAYLNYITALILFGSNGIVASYIALNSYEIVLLRTLIGSLLLMSIYVARKEKLTFYRHRRSFLFLCMSGMAMGASWIFLYEAYAQIGVSIASLFYYCGPVLVMALSPVMFGERLTIFKLAGFSLVLCGIILVNGGGTQGSENDFGAACGILSAIMYAFMVICNKKATAITGLENSMMQLFISFLTVTAFVGVKQGFAMEIAASSIVPILLLGIVNTGIGCYFYFSSIGRLPVQTVAICGYLEPLSAVMFSVAILHEIMTVMQIAGAVLIIGGAIFAECAGFRHRTAAK